MSDRPMAAVSDIDNVVTAKREAHRANLARYARLLATELTPTERDFIHRRIREERLALEALAREGLGSAGAMAFASKERPSHVNGQAVMPAP